MAGVMQKSDSESFSSSRKLDSNEGLTRRKFLSTAALLALPTLLPSTVFGASKPAPSSRITLGLIGCGNMGMGNAEEFLRHEDCQIVAACDVDANHLKRAVTRVNKHYGNEDCKAYSDFRELLARRDIDAVMVAVPDHWHELVEVEAAHQKKDIYGEKPLARTVAEQQAVVKAVEKNKRIFQAGSWQRSLANFRKGAEIVRNGLIGKVTRVEVGLPGGNHFSGGDEKKMTPGDPPPELNYDFWTGPSKLLTYIEGRVHRNWRWNYNTGGGQLMDWIGHHCDIAHWGLGFDNSGPFEVEGHGEFPAADAVWNTATTYKIEAKYPNDIPMTIAGGYPEIRPGTKWIGTEGWVYVTRGVFEGSNEDWRDYKDLPDDLAKIKLYVSKNHQGNFLECVKSRKPTVTPVQTAHHSAVPGHLGLISMLTGRKIKWDVKSEKIIGDTEASKLLSRPFRAPWKLA
jgi:predicted dehydrogenase